MRRKTVEELNEMLKSKDKTFYILYETDKNHVMCTCLKCNQLFEKTRKELHATYGGCPVCGNYKIIKGYNDVGTTDSWVIDYLVNKDDAYKYSRGSDRYVVVKCPDCGLERQVSVSNLVHKGFSCPCNYKIFGRTYSGINDIATTSPWMVKYLLNPEDAKIISTHSQKKIKFICPECMTIIERDPDHVDRNGFRCPICSDGVSYPNKFGRAFIKQTPVKNIEFEFRRDWTQGKIYDIYFEYQDKKYFIEMDGGLHYKASYNKSLDDIVSNDKLKDDIAKEHNIIMIRIDCRESKKDYIANSIENSLLNDLFDLNLIDWNLCELYAQKSMIREVCKEYDRGELFLSEIAEKFSLSLNAVRKFIKVGNENGLCKVKKNNHKRAAEIEQKRINNDVGKLII